MNIGIPPPPQNNVDGRQDLVMRRRGNLVVLSQRSTAFHAASACAACSFSSAACCEDDTISAACATRPYVVRQHCFGGAGVFQCSCHVMRRRGNVVVLTQRSTAFHAASTCAAPGFCLWGAGPQLCHVKILLQHNLLSTTLQLVIPKDVPLASHWPPRPQDSKQKTGKRKLTSSTRLSGHRPPFRS